MIRKPFIFLFLFFILSCKSTSYFNTSNDLNKQPGTLFLIDGSEENGEISISLENEFAVSDSLIFNSNGINQKISLKDVKSYKVNGDYYFPKYINLDFNNVNHLLFVKRLTGESSGIQLFELLQRNQGMNRGNIYSYFISLPTQSRYENWSTGSVHLVPDFDKKMSRIVADCPALALKIENKEKDYFLPRMTFSDEKKIAVFKRIIEEYDQCKSALK